MILINMDVKLKFQKHVYFNSNSDILFIISNSFVSSNYLFSLNFFTYNSKILTISILIFIQNIFSNLKSGLCGDLSINKRVRLFLIINI